MLEFDKLSQTSCLRLLATKIAEVIANPYIGEKSEGLRESSVGTLAGALERRLRRQLHAEVGRENASRVWRRDGTARNPTGASAQGWG